MFGKKKSEVLVAGAGPVGMFAALLLEQRGVEVEIIDSAWRSATHSCAPVLHPHTLHLLDDVGIAGDLIDRGVRIEHIGFWDREGERARLDLRALHTEFPFVLAVPQDVLENVLEDRLARVKRKVKWNHRIARVDIEAECVLATVDKLGKDSVGYAIAGTEWVIEKEREFRVPFVLGADGHDSLIRRALKMGFEETGAADAYAVFEFDGADEFPREMRVVFSGDKNNVLWPLPNGRWRWSFQVDCADASALEANRTKSRVPTEFTHGIDDSDEQLASYIRERAPWFDGTIGKIHWSGTVPFERRVASRFHDGRCFLAGEAAHMAGAIGAHSLNVGLGEAHELAWMLAGVLRRHVSMDRLAKYDERRRAEWRFLLGLEGGLMPTDGTDPWIAKHRQRILECLPSTGVELAVLSRQLGLEPKGESLEPW